MAWRSLLGALVLVCSALGSPARADDAQATVSFEVFESGLAPHGEWMVAGNYGHVWRPIGAGPDWRPYVDGEWVWTTEGWYWSSDEPWAWATYHYGRWVFDPWLGWVWVPGYAWAPAWVAWRVGGGFIGWAPLPPGLVAWWVDPVPIAATYWVFVPAPLFVGHPVHHAVVPPGRVPEIIPRTRPAPPRRAGVATPAPAPPRGGPPLRLVESEVGHPVRPAPIVAVPTPAAARGRSGDAVPAFRPGAAVAPAPAQARVPAATPERRPPAASSEGARPPPPSARGEGSGAGGTQGAAPAPQRPSGAATAPAPAPEAPKRGGSSSSTSGGSAAPAPARTAPAPAPAPAAPAPAPAPAPGRP